jgi:hypothetical protein
MKSLVFFSSFDESISLPRLFRVLISVNTSLKIINSNIVSLSPFLSERELGRVHWRKNKKPNQSIHKFQASSSTFI